MGSPRPDAHPIDTREAPTVQDGTWWFCPPCGGLHPQPTCSGRVVAPDEQHPWLESPLQLCACCGRVVVPNASRYSSLFCSTCGPRVTAINGEARRLVFPVCRDPRANLATFTPAGGWTEDAAAHALRFFGSQLEELARLAAGRAWWLFTRLCIRTEEPIPLETYLAGVSQLRADVFQPSAALEELTALFSAYYIDVPSECPALAARVQEEARRFARAVHPDDAVAALARGRAATREVALAWASRVLDEVLPVPSFADARAMMVIHRRNPTYRALARAAAQELERVHGPAWLPAPPRARPGLRVEVLAAPGERWPASIPDEVPEEEYVVVGLDGAPHEPDMLPYVYHLSLDTPGRRWVLWGMREEEESFFAPAPVAWCAQRGLSPREAGFLLLEASLTRDRRTHGMHLPRPAFEMGGLLDEDLTEVLLDRVWATDA